MAQATAEPRPFVNTAGECVPPDRRDGRGHALGDDDQAVLQHGDDLVFLRDDSIILGGELAGWLRLLIRGSGLELYGGFRVGFGAGRRSGWRGLRGLTTGDYRNCENRERVLPEGHTQSPIRSMLDCATTFKRQISPVGMSLVIRPHPTSPEGRGENTGNLALVSSFDLQPFVIDSSFEFQTSSFSDASHSITSS